MHATLATFWVQRGGGEAREYEDAFSPRENGVRSAPRMRFAVADGVSEGMLSGRWADLLVRTYCTSRRRRVNALLGAAIASWTDEVDAYVKSRTDAGRPIQWFEEPGLARGAFATLLGIEFGTRRHSAGSWSALSIGDSCVFQVRGNELVTAFPLETAADFDNAPGLVPSRPPRIGSVVDAARAAKGEWRSRDHFYVATDAVSRWFLSEVERGAAPWQELAQFDPDDRTGFEGWVQDLRVGGRMRDDDVTLLRIGIL